VHTSSQAFTRVMACEMPKPRFSLVAIKSLSGLSLGDGCQTTRREVSSVPIQDSTDDETYDIVRLISRHSRSLDEEQIYVPCLLWRSQRRTVRKVEANCRHSRHLSRLPSTFSSTARFPSVVPATDSIGCGYGYATLTLASVLQGVGLCSRFLPSTHGQSAR
jgi:hypothetical protein